MVGDRVLRRQGPSSGDSTCAVDPDSDGPGNSVRRDRSAGNLVPRRLGHAILGLTVVGWLLSSTASFAVKAYPKTMVRYQPDGTPISVRMIGDERQVFHETEEGHTIVRDPDGWWVYVDPSYDGKSNIVPTPFRAGIDRLPPDWPRHVRPHLDPTAAVIPWVQADDGSVGAAFREWRERQRREPGGLTGLRAMGTSSTPLSIPVLVILVEFSDWAHTNGAGTPVAGEPDYQPISGQPNTAATWQTLFDDRTVPGGLNHYYWEASYGQFQWDVVVAQRGVGQAGGGSLVNDGWYENPETMAYWGADSGSASNCTNDGGIAIRGLIEWAIQIADPDVNYAQFDTDGNGTISDAELMIFVVHAREGQENYGDGCGTNPDDPNNDHIWSHKWVIDSNLTVDGKTVPSGHVYAIEPEFSPLFNYTTNPWTLLEKYFGVGVYAHEAFHTLGSTDIYDTGYDAVPAGEWDLMDSGSYNGAKAGTHPAHMGTPLKQDIRMNADPPASSYGWIPDEEIVDIHGSDGAHGIAALGGSTYVNVLHRLVSPADSTEWFMLENRADVGYYEPYLPEHGLLIWHRDTGATVGNNSYPYEANVERAGWDSSPTGLNTSELSAALSLDDGQTEFTSTSDPNNALNNESSSGLSDLRCVGAESSHIYYAYGTLTGPNPGFGGATVSGGTDADAFIDNNESATVTVAVTNSSCAGDSATGTVIALSVAADSDIPAGSVTITPASVSLGTIAASASLDAAFTVTLACDPSGYAGRSITFAYTINGTNFTEVVGSFKEKVDKDVVFFDDAENAATRATWSDTDPGLTEPSCSPAATAHGRWDWQIPTDRAHSGDAAYHTPEASANLCYQNAYEYWMSPVIDLPAGVDPKALDFWQAANIPQPGYSRARIWVWTDTSGTWTRLDWYKDGGDLAWEHVNVDLSAFAGAGQIRILFTMYTYGCWPNSTATEGWYLDDIAVLVDEQDTCDPCTPLSPPTGVTASSTVDNRVDLNWTTVGSAVEYRVYRSLVSGGPFSYVATVAAPGTSHADTTVTGGLTYYYVVRSYGSGDSACESANSDPPASVTAHGICPLPPTFAGLSSVNPSAGGACALDLSWAAATSQCGNPISYNIYRHTASPFTPDLSKRIATGVTGTTYTDASGFAASTTYYYIVRAVDVGNLTEDSNTTSRSGTPVGTTPVAQNLYPASGAQSFDTWATGSMGDWSTGYFTGSAADWRGAQNCSPTHSGANILRYGGNGCTNNYAGSRHAFAMPPALSVPSNATNSRADFYHRWAITTDGDGVYLRVSLDGSNFTYVPASAFLAGSYNGTSGTTAVWNGSQSASFTHTTVDLDAACNAASGQANGCAGRTVYLAWVAYTNTSGADDGWYIDDVQITTQVPGACGGTPLDVEHLTVTSKAAGCTVEWQNPPNPPLAYGSTRINGRTDTYPTSPSDSELVTQDGTAAAYDSYTHLPAGGTTMHYKAFVNSAANATGVWSGPGLTTRSALQGSIADPVKWSFSTGATALSSPRRGFNFSGVYVASNDRRLYAMQPGAGGGLWPSGWIPAPMNAPAQMPPSLLQVAAGTFPASPLTVRAAFAGSTDNHVYAFDADTGEEIWYSADLGGMIVANPMLMHTAYGGIANLVIVGTRNASAGNKLCALNMADGSTAWCFTNAGSQGGDDLLGIGIISGPAFIDAAWSHPSYPGWKRAFFASRAAGAGSPATLWCVRFTATQVQRMWAVATVGDSDGAPTSNWTTGHLLIGTNAGAVKVVDPDSGAVVRERSFGDGAVKEYVVYDSVRDRLVFSTESKVWSVPFDNLNDAARTWSVPLDSPSRPTWRNKTAHVYVGACTDAGCTDGKLVQLDSTADWSSGSTRSVTLGQSSWLGGVTIDDFTSPPVAHLGSASGRVYTVQVPLP